MVLIFRTCCRRIWIWSERIMDLKHLKPLETIKDGISIEVLNDLIENGEKYSGELLEILDYTVGNAGELCKEGSFVLHIVAMYTLAYFKDKRAYPGIVAVAKLPPEIINPLLEDTITEGLSSIIASVYDGNLDPIKGIIESRECDKYVRRAALGSLVALVVNGIIDRDEVVCYFKELYNQKMNLLSEDVIECLIDKSLDIHPTGLEEEINKANDGDVLGFSSPDIDYRLEEQGAESIECILEEAKMYSEYCLVSRDDVLSLSKWLGNTRKMEYTYDDEGDDEDNPFITHGLDYDEDDFLAENTTTVRNIEKIGRNHPCPCGSGKKYKKCCGK